MERLDCTVTGRVQGVAFRWYTQRQARLLGLAGWVRNLSDGSVRFVAEGPRPQLEALLVWARTGPQRARVTSCDHRWQDATGQFEDFAITG
jgi:acylphosphatase